MSKRTDQPELSKLREQELAESLPHKLRAQREKKPITYIAKDGCGVTVFPDGTEFFNAEDWW